GQLLQRLQADLYQYVHFLFADPVALLRLHARPVPAAHAVDLAALHRERHIDRALVARHDLEPGAGRVVVHVGVVARRTAGGARAQHRLLLLRILEGLDLRSTVGGANTHAGVGRADIENPGRIELEIGLVVEQRPDDGARHQGGKRGAVLGCDRADIDAGPGG